MSKDWSPLRAAQEAFRSLEYSGDTPLADYIKVFEEKAAAVRAAGGTVDEEDMLGQLLVSMPWSYVSIVTALDTLFHRDKRSVSLALVKKTLLEEEARQKAEAAGDLGPSSFVFSNIK